MSYKLITIIIIFFYVCVWGGVGGSLSQNDKDFLRQFLLLRHT